MISRRGMLLGGAALIVARPSPLNGFALPDMRLMPLSPSNIWDQWKNSPEFIERIDRCFNQCFPAED